MNTLDKQYCDLISDILANGTVKGDRTGTGNISVFGRTIRHKMSDGFPLITTKKVYFKAIIVELLWFLSGSTNIKYMVDNNCNIWVGDAFKKYESLKNKNLSPVTGPLADKYAEWYKQVSSKEDFIEKIKTDVEFANIFGDLGPVYGKQWRDWSHDTIGIGKIDQIGELINKLINNPEDRRMIVSAWNVPEIPDMTLPPCHYSFQVYARPLSCETRVSMLSDFTKLYIIDSSFSESEMLEYCDWQNIPKYELSLMFNIRSNDVPLGLPFNLASYGILLELLAKHTNMIPGELIASIGDAHNYLNQIDGVKEQLTRSSFKLPTIKISDRKVNDLSEYQIEDFKLIGYKAHESIKIPLSN